MDGDLFAVKTGNAGTAGEVAGVINVKFRSGVESVSLDRGSRNEVRGAAPMASLLVRTITIMAAILGTCGAALLGRVFLPPAQAVDQLVPDIIALVVFFLAARLR